MTADHHTVPWPADESWGVSPIDPRTNHAGAGPILEFATESEALQYGHEAWPFAKIAVWVRTGAAEWRRVHSPDSMSFADVLEALYDCGVDLLPASYDAEGFRDWFAKMRREAEREAERQPNPAA